MRNNRYFVSQVSDLFCTASWRSLVSVSLLLMLCSCSTMRYTPQPSEVVGIWSHQYANGEKSVYVFRPAGSGERRLYRDSLVCNCIQQFSWRLGVARLELEVHIGGEYEEVFGVYYIPVFKNRAGEIVLKLGDRGEVLHREDAKAVSALEQQMGDSVHDEGL